MRRLIFVIVCVAVVLVTTVIGAYAYALAVGVASGAAMLILGIARGGALGGASSFGQRPQDVSARIGMALAAAGIAAASLGHQPPYPPPFRVFYTACLGIGVLGAVWLAARGGKSPPA